MQFGVVWLDMRVAEYDNPQKVMHRLDRLAYLTVLLVVAGALSLVKFLLGFEYSVIVGMSYIILMLADS